MKLIVRILKITAIALLASIGLVTLLQLLDNARSRPPEKSDFVQEYLNAKATVSGINPYQPLDVLAEQFGITTQFRHPSPHPPSFVIFSVPLAFFSYRDAAFIWFVIGLACLLISLRLLFSLGTLQLAIVFLIAVGWLPVWANLYLGQLLLLQLVLLTLTWHSLRAQREALGGFLLGLTIAVKLITWPLLIFLIVKRRFRAAAAAVGVVALTNLIALAILGPGPVFNYYLHTGREVGSIYSDHAFNISAWSIGARLFAGTKTTGDVPFHIEPLISAPSLVNLATVAGVLAITIYAFFSALKARAFDTSFAILTCAAIILSPVSWISYLVLLMIPLTMTLSAGDWQSRGVTVLCLIAPYFYQSVVPLFGPSSSFAPGMLTMLPMFTVLLMIMVLYYRDRAQVNDDKRFPNDLAAE
jgi:hypothetical protein